MARLRSEPAIPSDQEALLAREVSRELETQHAAGKPMRLQVAGAGHDVTTLDLPPVAARLLIDMLSEMGAGRAVTLVPAEAELTTQQAADLLNVSRPYIVGLIGKGVLPGRMVGNQRRVPLKELLAYRAGTMAKALDALEEISAIDQELGLR
jgi:excisionase family DNA binding protein